MRINRIWVISAPTGSVESFDRASIAIGFGRNSFNWTDVRATASETWEAITATTSEAWTDINPTSSETWADA
jgi:hypothetical protein